MSKIIAKVQEKTVLQLSELVKKLLVEVDKEVFAIPASDQEEVRFGFEEQINRLFNELQGTAVKEDHVDKVINFDDLTLVLEEDMDVLVAVEGMVAAARNKILGPYISFNTRLNSLLENEQVDESVNPLDPGNVLEAFKESTIALAMNADRTLLVFRRFSTIVFGEMVNVLSTANKILIDHKIMPELGDTPILSPVKATGRVIPRSHLEPEATSNFGRVQTEQVGAFSNQQGQDNTELFNLMQNLMHSPAGAPASMPPGSMPQGSMPQGYTQDNQASYPPGAAVQGAAYGAGQRNYVVPAEMLSPDMLRGTTTEPAPDQTVEVVDQKQLISLLANIQATLAKLPQVQPGTSQVESAASQIVDIKKSLAEMLEAESTDEVVNAVDRQSHDVIHLVTMLYEAIWNDDSVPIPIKELIGRTQITVMQVALTDTNFFNKEDHPARALLNEFASAGIGWSEVEDLQEDSLYKTISDFVQKILTEYDGAEDFFEELLTEFKQYRAREFARGRRLEQRIKFSREGKIREEFARKLVTQRVQERILGRELDPFVSDLLSGSFHQFLVLLVLKEGPGSKAWTQAMNTIDVLLWTVQPHEHEEDRERLETINPRVISNLQRALHIVKLDSETIDLTLMKLRQVQQDSFSILDDAELALDKMLDSEEMVFEGMEDGGASATGATAPEIDPETLEEGDEHLQTIDSLGVGTWFEFAIDEDQNVRCKLAARINAIDKFIFVNRQGVKVLEKSRMGLALEFKQETVRMISDGLLFSRALESVIGNLRQTQSEMKSGGAYQPASV